MSTAHAVSRRRFIAGTSGIAVVAALSGPEALAQGRRRPRPTLRGGRFAEGVLSGDPTPDGITLWTRVAEAEGNGTVGLQVARDPDFRRQVARELVSTSAASDHAVKLRLRGLDPYEQYWYRFTTRDEASRVGRFRTALPPDSRQPVRFAFFSCQDYTFGYFNAHRLMADEDVDFVVNLGDYIYSEAYYTPGDAFQAVRADPVGYAETLDQYRAKYKLYRTEWPLRKMHAQFPMISIWDDHEVLDNYAGGAGPTGGLTPDKEYTDARKRAAYKAYFESMPTFPAVRNTRRIYRALRFGLSVDMVMLDSRQLRADQPCGDAQLGPACADLDQPRTFLGRRQMDFVKNRLSASPAAWKVIANQVMVMPTIYPGGDYIGFDSWQGYPQERRELLEHLRRDKIEDVVFVTGDIHTFIAGDVRVANEDTRPVATEFVGGSISSPGLGEGGGGILPGADPANPQTPESIIDLLKSTNPWAVDADFDHHGYGLVEASQRDFRCTLRRVDKVKYLSRTALPDERFSFRITPGQPSLLD